MPKIQTFCLALLAMAVPAAALADFRFYVGAGAGGGRVERDDINLTYKVVTTNVSVLADPPFNGLGPYAADPFIEVRDPEGTDFVYKLFGGVRYGAYIGLEAAYIDLGTAEAGFDYQIPGITRSSPDALEPIGLRPVQDRQIDVDTEIDGFTLSVIGFLPLNDRIELFGKLGVLRWDRTTTVNEQILAIQPVSQPGAPDTRLFSGLRDPNDPTLPDPSTPFATTGPNQNLFTCFPSPVIDGNGGSQPRPLDAQCASLLPERSSSGTDLALGFGLQIKASERVSLRAEFEWFDIDGTDLAWAATASLVFGF